MSDLPQHAAQVALLADLHHPNFAYASMFRLNWFTPYLLGYLLLYFITPFTGIVSACKLVVSFFIVGFPLSAALLLSAAEADVFWAILCIPGTYGFAYQWGFLNFLIAAPLGILFLWFVIRSADKYNWRTAIILAASISTLFFCHALICGFFALCAGLYLLAQNKPLTIKILQVLPLGTVLPIATLWMHRTLANPAARRPMIWDLGWINSIEAYYGMLSDELGLPSTGWGRITGFAPRLLGMFPSWHATILAAAIFILPTIACMRLQRRRALWIPFTLCVAVLLVCPHAVFGTEFVYQRFTMFSIPLFLLMLQSSTNPSKTRTTLKSASAALVVVLIVLASHRALAFSRETRGFQAALALMQPGERVLSLAFDHEDRISIAPTFLHFPQWYGAQKQGVVDPSVAVMHPELVIYQPGKTPDAVLWDFEWSPEEFVWDDYSASQYRYFVVRSDEDVYPTLFAKAPCTVTLQLHQDDWWLYERAPGCGGN